MIPTTKIVDYRCNSQDMFAFLGICFGRGWAANGLEHIGSGYLGLTIDGTVEQTVAHNMRSKALHWQASFFNECVLVVLHAGVK